MKIVITGSGGFIGSNLIGYLNESLGYSVSKLNLRNNWGQEIPSEYDVLIHLAGKAHDLKQVADDREYYDINTELTCRLYDSFLQGSGRDFIFVSSVKAVADSLDGPLTEQLIPDPKTPYGKSKMLAEKYLLSKPLPLGKRLFILRPCMVHGPGNKGNLNLLYKFVSKGIPYPLGSFLNRRSFLYIDNFMFIIQKIIDDHDISSGIYNLSDDHPLSTLEVVNIISDCLHKKSNVWNIPKALVRTLAKVGDVFRLPLNSDRLAKMTDNYIVDNSKIKKACGISRLPIAASDGLRSTINSF